MKESFIKEDKIKVKDSFDKHTLAIIGGGLCGILTAKLAIDRGLNVFIFEKNSDLIGIWSVNGYAWPGMSLNISKYQDCLIDFM